MQNKIVHLVKIYINKKNEYLFEDPNNLEFDEYDDINISLVFANGKYHIFIFLLENNKILSKVLYMKSENNLIEEYNKLKEDMSILNIDDFIDKYYETIMKTNS